MMALGTSKEKMQKRTPVKRNHTAAETHPKTNRWETITDNIG